MRIHTILLVGILAISSLCRADEFRQEDIYAKNVSITATPTAITNTYPLSGYLESVTIDLLSPFTTCDVAVVVVPNATTLTGITLFSTSGISGDAGPFNVRFNRHDTSGDILSGDPLGPFPFTGEKVVFQVSNCTATGKNVRAMLKLKK